MWLLRREYNFCHLLEVVGMNEVIYVDQGPGRHDRMGGNDGRRT